jgi:hypothetical protein
MEGGITGDDRTAVLRAAVANVDREEMKAALASTSDPRFAAPKAIGNALNALGRHRDPVEVVGRTPYRAALPYVAAAIADACLARTIEVLGDHSDDPTREQLLDALDQVRGSYSDVTIAVMLASVANGDMPASDLCFDILAGDDRFGVAHRSDVAPADGSEKPVHRADRAVTPEQREARRLKKQKDAEERRRKAAAARKAGEQVRRMRKQDRSRHPAGPDPGSGEARSAAGVAPRLTRRAALTPAQEEEFDRADPWAAGVVFAWVPFDLADATQPGVEGKEGKARPCVVVAGSGTHLLVRAGYSEGGSKSRDWKSTPLRQWKRAGFDRPTWIDAAFLRVPRDQTQAPVGWLTPDDWNALW